MTSQALPISGDQWPYTKTDEAEMLLARYYRRRALDDLGTALDVEWFDDHQASNDPDEARTALAEYIVTTGGPAECFEAVAPEPSGFSWFLGYHYVVTETETTPAAQSGPPTERWQAVISEVTDLAGDSEQVRAFLHGLVEADGRFRGRVRTDFSDAMANGSAHYDDGTLWLSNQAELPAQVTGITTWKTGNSGRGYNVAAELVPVIETALNQLDEEASGPVSTPEQSVPEELDRRVPKFHEILDKVEVSDEDIERFEAILREEDALSFWKDYVAPTVKFRPQAKKAILCMLASPADAHGTKGRTNAILFGPPGTGKSAFKNFLVEEFGAYSIDGARVSKTDLTYNKNTSEDGLLVRAHKGLAVIEEADELDDDALGAALTALGEAGQIEIRDIRLPAEVRGVLLGNYRSREEIVAAHSDALFNRFEFVIEFDRLSENERDAAIDWQYDHFRQPKAPGDTADLKRFIAWVRTFEPELPDNELGRIKEYKQQHIDAIGNVREGISLMTVAYTIARLNHRDVTLSDYKQAFELVTSRESVQ